MGAETGRIGAVLAKALGGPRRLSLAELELLIGAEDPEDVRAIRSAAHSLKRRLFGDLVSVRGLIEAGNRCAKDCLYCGIRKSNAGVARYRLSVDDVVRMAETCAAADYGSVVIQAGEIESEENTRHYEECLRRIARLGLGVTLSLGEQTEETYGRWREAGAERYLLRIETSSPELYAKLHPADHSWGRRRECLEALKRCGYQTGTGVMSALPGQTARDLARDVEFFAEADVDMIGMGPYIPHPGTPMGAAGGGAGPEERLRVALNMISAVRLQLHDVNVASTTALQALAPDGRERGILAGANVIMPNATDVEYRGSYALYSGKPGTDENAAETRMKLERSLAAIGERLNYGKRGDSPHYAARAKERRER